MLEYLILDNKPKITFSKINEQGIDLLAKTINLDKANNGNYLLVNEFYIARPDLISLAVYGDDQYGDVICKINGISNPFELNEGDILYIPSLESIYNMLNTQERNVKTVPVNKNEDIVSTNKIGDQKKKTDKRSPAQQTEGDFNYIIDTSLGMAIY